MGNPISAGMVLASSGGRAGNLKKNPEVKKSHFGENMRKKQVRNSRLGPNREISHSAAGCAWWRPSW
jgi:hypothetical protein